jgi:N-acetylneuraminic acid mutarotase
MLALAMGTLLAMASVVAACGGPLGTTTTEPATTTSQAASTTTIASTSTTAVPTTTTVAQTTTTESAAALAEYRRQMRALWDRYDAKMNVLGRALEGVDFQNPSNGEIETLQVFGRVLRDFVTDLGDIDAPQSLAAAHAAYLDGNRKMYAAYNQMIEGLSTNSPTAILRGLAALMKYLEEEDESTTAAEASLRKALAFHLSLAASDGTSGWAELGPSDPLPPPRMYGSFVYDPVRRLHLLFGGELAEREYSNDTWAYDPAADTWTQVSPSGVAPSGRSDSSRAYDPVSGQIILFGGDRYDANREDYVFYNDTWTYDPAKNTWTALKPEGVNPSARSASPLVYDPVGKRMLLFGGGVYDLSKERSTCYNDTWAYDPVTNTWTKLEPSGPVPAKRWSHALVYEPIGRKIILFGGEVDPRKDKYVFYNDTWAYDPAANTWTELKPSGFAPSVRSGAALVYDPVGKKIILFGGGKEDFNYNDTWVYDPAANTWTELKPSGFAPSARFGAAAVYDPVYRAIILFGGGDDTYVLDDSWAFLSEE